MASLTQRSPNVSTFRSAPSNPERPRQQTRCGPSWPACEVATMLSERDIELAHPEAFDFAFGNLPSARRAEFNRHLTSCRHCQAVIDEYSEIGQIIKILP